MPELLLPGATRRRCDSLSDTLPVRVQLSATELEGGADVRGDRTGEGASIVRRTKTSIRLLAKEYGISRFVLCILCLCSEGRF